MAKYYTNLNKNPWKFLPKTFLIKNGLSDPTFLNFITETQNCTFSKSSADNIWIIKPGEHSNRGKGIRVWETLDQIKHYIKYNPRKSYIIQKYLSEPLLYNNRKFDIRCFGLFISINGIKKGYFYNGGYLRTSSEEFDLSDIHNRDIHLTNDAIQSNGENYGKYENWNKLSFSDFEKYLKK